MRGVFVVGSRVLRTRTVRNAGKFVVTRGSSLSYDPPPTTHPPTNASHSSTTKVKQYVPTNPQRQNSSTAARTKEGYNCNTPRAWWHLHFLTILHLPGDSASSLRERLVIPPYRGVETFRPLCHRGHRCLMLEAGMAQA